MSETGIKRKINCICQEYKFDEKDNPSLLKTFSDIRNQCPVLKKILVPDKIWAKFQSISRFSSNSVGHNYKVLSALQLGILSKLTFPIHQYLMDNNETPKDIEKNYRKDLIEDWMEKENSIKRHEKARIHEGKLNELLCASWLENKGWKIDNLEALGGSFDIEATTANNIPYSIEVKYIGQENGMFEKLEKSRISGDAFAGTFSIYDGYNYFLFKTYHAAKQLSKSKKKRLAIIVFSSLTWGFNRMPIENDWINSLPLEFSENATEKWNAFLTNKKKEPKFKDIGNDLESFITNLDEIWIVHQHGDMEYTLEKVIN